MCLAKQGALRNTVTHRGALETLAAHETLGGTEVHLEIWGALRDTGVHWRHMGAHGGGRRLEIGMGTEVNSMPIRRTVSPLITALALQVKLGEYYKYIPHHLCHLSSGDAG